MADRVRADRIAKLTSLSRRTIVTMSAAGKIPGAARTGKIWTYDEGTVLRWLQELEASACPRTSTGVVTPSGAGSRLPASSIVAAFERAIWPKRAQRSRRGGERFRCHDLRHAYAIRSLRAGTGIYDLSRHLGHSSVKTTEIYLGFLTAERRAGAQTGAQ